LTVLVEVPLLGLEPKTDPQGRQGRRVKRTGGNEVWAKEMSAGSRAAVLLNGGSPETRIPYSGPTSDTPPNWVPRLATWGHKNLDYAKSGFSASTPSHGVAMLLIRPE
jgi:alpha-galactosidase